VLPSPPDSIEWPTEYIRGIEDLREKVDAVSRLTAGDLVYVGEWHSHPDGYSSQPSEDDIKAHQWLTNQMSTEGLPGLIVIQGEQRDPHFLIEPGIES
jgi:integrative and conjugative element protein (TIGR02256 family)